MTDSGCGAQMGTQEIWDYLSKTQASLEHRVKKPFSVMYAGALNRRKNEFLYKWGAAIRSFSVNLYGGGFEPDKAEGREHFNYMGFVKSDELIASHRGDFGLVWDGNSLDECAGDFGEYLKYNNPHKTSLYIRCELPVIIWRKAALADFIEKNHIGLCINSLKELDNRLEALGEEEYMAMKNNVRTISQKIAAGHYFKQAVETAINQLIIQPELPKKEQGKPEW